MGTPDDGAETATAEMALGIAIEVESDATLGYASIQHSVRVVCSLRLTNHCPEPIENLQVLITCNPQFAQRIKVRFDRLGPSETRRISPIDLHPDHTFLAELQESVRAAVKVSVLAGTDQAREGRRPQCRRGSRSNRPRIVERLRNLMPRDLQRTNEGGNTFYWSKDLRPRTWTDFRICDHTDASRQHTDEVCLEELSGLALYALKHAGASPRPDVARAVCRLLGMARTPAESEGRVNGAVNQLVALGMASELDGSIRPVS